MLKATDISQREFDTFEQAAAAIAVENARLGIEDGNPFPVTVAGNMYHACGPTTGLWLEANKLTVAAKINGVTFAW